MLIVYLNTEITCKGQPLNEISEEKADSSYELQNIFSH